MPICPYAKRIKEDYEETGLPMVFCEQLQQKVTVLAFPCYKDFEMCRYYKPIVTTKPMEAIKVKKRSCITCVYYSEYSRKCLKMDIEVSDPNMPPCKTGSKSNAETENPTLGSSTNERKETLGNSSREKGFSVLKLFKKMKRAE